MFAVPDGPLTREVWMRYALVRIQELVDKPRADMTDTELAIYTFATAALSGGQPIVPLGSPGLRAVEPARARLCRVCGAEWPLRGAAEHVAGCPIRTATA
ncbi:hypothetical protein GCM10017691_03840 [Pseudonocardia petroleophila]|uniref:Uncharacterized protein n=1 Tax=Pseudonocardia petroleophila TaxID=37331 RepID=A0A7G7MKQ3_9PSEU|nr:hypothetical protein [Pseudonocardia petroleophila]QNG53364.1 hypothetical protein H6H00_05065 [Pseudonocardia petroleophila]